MIIVLVVLVVIFVITLGIDGCHGSGKPDPAHPGAVGALKGLQGNRFLAIGDKASTTCQVLGPTVLRVSGSCTVTFEKRAFFSKATRVVFRPSALVQVMIDPKNGPTQEKDQTTGDCVASAVDHAGGTMTLTGNATIFLQRAPC